MVYKISYLSFPVSCLLIAKILKLRFRLGSRLRGSDGEYQNPAFAAYHTLTDKFTGLRASRFRRPISSYTIKPIASMQEGGVILSKSGFSCASYSGR